MANLKVRQGDPELVLKIREKQIQQLYGQSWLGRCGILVTAVGICVILWDHMAHMRLVLWMGIFLVINIIRHIHGAVFLRKKPSGPSILVWAKQHAFGSFVTAVLWGGVLVFLWPAIPVYQALVSICIVAVSASAVLLYCSWTPSYISYLTIPVPLCAIRLILEPGLSFKVVGVLGVLFALILFKSGKMMHIAGETVLLSGLVNEELNDRLAEEVTERKASEQKIQRRNLELERLNQEVTDAKISLEESMKSIKQLNGLLPICASCKKIRNDDGYWEQLEEYLRDHSGAEFSHGICPECARKLYPEIFGKNVPSLKLDPQEV